MKKKQSKQKKKSPLKGSAKRRIVKQETSVKIEEEKTIKAKKEPIEKKHVEEESVKQMNKNVRTLVQTSYIVR